ncbi:MAG: transcription elongation factor GreA [Spirochaetes bacterium]|nr:transcription elongation factor GreA [Spirochaetota bacterium]
MSETLEEKKQKIKEELENLRYEFKVELPKKIAQARSYGDLKENADYHASRERQSFVKARLSQLNSQLSQLSNINISQIEENKVGYGSRVTVLDIDNNEMIEFTFVHPNEVKPSEGKISANSPIGAALNNRTVGEEVEASIPAGKKRYLIQKLITFHGNEFTA